MHQTEYDRNRTWIEKPLGMDSWHALAEWFRQQKNRAGDQKQSESRTFYMVHDFNFYPSHMTFAFSDNPRALRRQCRFYTWRW